MVKCEGRETIQEVLLQQSRHEVIKPDMMAIKMERNQLLIKCQSLKTVSTKHFSRNPSLMPSTPVHWVPHLNVVIALLTLQSNQQLCNWLVNFFRLLLEGRESTCVWLYPCCQSIGRSSRSNYFHNTQLLLPFHSHKCAELPCVMRSLMLIEWCSISILEFSRIS